MTRRAALARSIVGAATLVVLATGCPGPTGPTGVPQGGAFQHDPTCTLDGKLRVEIGDGTDGFGALGPGEAPIQHFGAQGGTHSFAGVRIGGLALEEYDVVLLQLTLFAASECPTLGEPCTGAPMNAAQTWVLGDVVPLNPVDDATIEQDHLLIPVGMDSMVLEALTEDPCGRVGLGQISYSR